MQIAARYTKSVALPEQLPKDRLPEIALAGRSNVGKSSLINRLLGHKKLARTSNTPGRTQTLNYYIVEPPGVGKHPFYLVDMPGYGYAEVSKRRRDEWGRLIDEYLNTRETLCGVIQLVDLRHPPQPLDLQMAAWLRQSDIPYLVVATKADKIARSKVPESVLVIAEHLRIDTADIIAFSAETGLGAEQLWQWVTETAKCQP